MDTLISVLLYLHALPGPGVYYESHVRQLEQQYEPQIIQLEADPKQLQDIMMIEAGQVDQVVVISDWATGS